jgi:hypothetical protein
MSGRRRAATGLRGQLVTWRRDGTAVDPRDAVMLAEVGADLMLKRTLASRRPDAPPDPYPSIILGLECFVVLHEDHGRDLLEVALAGLTDEALRIIGAQARAERALLRGAAPDFKTIYLILRNTDRNELLTDTAEVITELDSEDWCVPIEEEDEDS